MQRYDSYKDSGIQWLGEIPSHWEVVPLKYYSNIIMGQSPNGDDLTDNGQLLFMQGNAEFGNRYPHPTSYCDKCSKKSRVGDILMSVRAPVGALNISDRVYGIGRGLCSIRAINVERDFLWYYLIVARNGFKLVSTGSTYDSVSMDTLCGIKLVVPSLPEQQAIASYLDTATAKIDEAIAQQQKMIDLLNERKQIIINNAVTKGLNPNAKMKPSGIDWIGNIPEHWEVTKLKSIGTTINGVSHDSSYFGEGFPFVSYSDVYKNRVLPQTVVGLAKSSKAEQKFFSVEAGDVFFTRTSETVEEIGISSTCINTIPNAVFAGFLIRFRPIKGVLDSNFSSFYFRAQIHRSYFVKEMNLVIRASLSQQLLKGLPVLLPPVHEQVEIAQYLSQKTSMLEQAITAHNQQIALLQERKQIIINDVVTGKVNIQNNV